MTKEIRKLFYDQLRWYFSSKLQEEAGKIDDTYIYDECPDQFNSVTRGKWLSFLEILARDALNDTD